jgi:hypothetical protein
VCGSCTTGAEVNKQAVLCHRVLRMLQTVAQSSNTMTEETWHTLLLFLLHINSALLAPPTVKGNVCLQDTIPFWQYRIVYENCYDLVY